MIDTAAMNPDFDLTVLGEALLASKVHRKDMFMVTKVRIRMSSSLLVVSVSVE